MRGKLEAGKISVDEAIDCIMQIIEWLPEAVANVPEKLKKRAYWEKNLKRIAYDKPGALETLLEMPAFTFLRPAKPTPAAWRKVFAKHMGVKQFGDFLIYISAFLEVPPCKKVRFKDWKEQFAPENFQRVRPAESNKYLPNPHRGTATFQRFQGESVYPLLITSDTHGPLTFPKQGGKLKENAAYAPQSTVSYCRCPWAWLEPEQGKYNWKLMDDMLAAAKNAGQTLQFRFQPFTVTDFEGMALNDPELPQGKFVNLPRWYWKTGAKYGPDTVKYKNDVNVPDDNDPLYLKYFGGFVKEFAKRYDGHEYLETIDVSYAGYWGESGGGCTLETAAKLVDVYIRSFKKTQLLFPIGTAGLYYAAKSAAQKGKDIGWRADCIGDFRDRVWPKHAPLPHWSHYYDCYPEEIFNAGLENAWKTQPVIMESCGNPATWGVNSLDIDQIIHEGYTYHTSIFMPKSAFFPQKYAEKLIEFDKKIGYRFVLRQLVFPITVKPGEKLEIPIFMENVGCAPIYRDYKMALKFTMKGKSVIIKLKKDLRRVLPGIDFCREKITFPTDFSTGEVQVLVGIVDSNECPKVWFANEGKLNDGWLPLTRMEVKK